jgi:Ca2+-binding EF-hand superfamily protein
MGEEMIKRLKEKAFRHSYEHQSYKGNWFLSRGESEEKRAWSDIYSFIAKSFKLDYTDNMFSSIDIDGDEGVSLEEYLYYREEEEKKKKKVFMTKMFSTCDTNHDYKIDYFEARMPIVVDKNDSYYNSDAINPNYIPLPSVNYACRISQDNFKEYDLHSDKSVSFNEFSRAFKKSRTQNLVDDEVSDAIKKKYIINNTRDRFAQCDENNDSKIDEKEAMLETCHIDKAVFTIADKNENDFISMDELTALPAKYARFRQLLYFPLADDKVVYESSHSKTPEIYDLLLNSIDECDSNRDFKLDKSEATAEKCGFTEEEFLEADANKDGQFEYKDIGLIDTVRLFHEVDEDNNGKLDFDEWIKVY